MARPEGFPVRGGVRVKRVQQALSGIGIPVMAGVWRSDSITQSSPEQYVIYSTTMSEYAH